MVQKYIGCCSINEQCRAMLVNFFACSCFNARACNSNVVARQCFLTLFPSLMLRHVFLMQWHVSDSLPSPCLFLAPNCLFFLMIPEKCVERGITTNSHDLGVNFTLKSQNECISYTQILCNFKPNIKQAKNTPLFYFIIITKQ